MRLTRMNNLFFQDLPNPNVFTMADVVDGSYFCNQSELIEFSMADFTDISHGSISITLLVVVFKVEDMVLDGIT